MPVWLFFLTKYLFFMKILVIFEKHYRKIVFMKNVYTTFAVVLITKMIFDRNKLE